VRQSGVLCALNLSHVHAAEAALLDGAACGDEFLVEPMAICGKNHEPAKSDHSRGGERVVSDNTGSTAL